MLKIPEYHLKREIYFIKKIKTLAIVILIFSSRAFADTDGDFQYWNSESISWEVCRDWNMRLEEEFRFGDHATDFYYQHSDLGMGYSGLGYWLDLGINYRSIFKENDKNWNYENMAHYNATIKYKWQELSFSSRNRFENRFVEDEKNSWRYRNKFTVKLPKITQFEIQPYIANEIFIDFKEEKLNRNRLYGGIFVKLYKDLKGEIFYLWQTSDKDDHWLDLNVIGSKLKLSF